MAEPTTVGELAILLTSIKETMDLQFRGINVHLEKLDGLPMKVQEHDYRLAAIESSSTQRRMLWFTVLGWAVAIGAAAVGVIH